MNRRVKNAVTINYGSIMTSPSIKLLLILVTAISFTFSFWPFVSREFFHINKNQSIQFAGNLAIVVGICCICMLFLVLLTTRIGAQVGFAKGSKVTEIILTTLSREQLYLAHVLSSIMVALTSLCIVYLPMIIAALISNPRLTLDFSQVKSSSIAFIIFHMILTVTSMMVLAISLASLVKRSEDTGPYLMVCLLPFILSLIYESIKNDMYSGCFYFLNFIPLTSLIPSIGAAINNSLEPMKSIMLICTDIVFILICFFVGRKVFASHIAIK